MSEPTNAELIATAASIALSMRKVAENLAQNRQNEERQTLAAFSEAAAIAGGAMLLIARRLGCEDEVEALISKEQSRNHAARACSGVEGRA